MNLTDVARPTPSALRRVRPAAGPGSGPLLPEPKPQPGPSPDSRSRNGWQRLDRLSEEWLARYRHTARRLPHLDAESVGARVEQHLTGAAA